MCSLQQEDISGVSTDPHRHPRLHPMALPVGAESSSSCWVEVEKAGGQELVLGR